MDFLASLVKMVFPVKILKISTTSLLKAASNAQLDLLVHQVLPEDLVLEVCADQEVFPVVPDEMVSLVLLETWATLDQQERMENVDQLERKEKMLNSQLLVTDIVVFLEMLDLKEPKASTAKLALLVHPDQQENLDHKVPLVSQVSMVTKAAREKKASTEMMPPTAHAPNVAVIAVLEEVVSVVLEALAALVVYMVEPLVMLVVSEAVVDLEVSVVDLEASVVVSLLVVAEVDTVVP